MSDIHEKKPKHSTEENFQHFLSYSNLRVLAKKRSLTLEDLRTAYYAGADGEPPRAVITKGDPH
jgi:hypothetical protein